MDKGIKSRFEWALEELRIPPGGTVLEVGPGAGIALEMIATLVSDGKVIAIDNSSAMLSKAKARLKKSGLSERVTFLEADAASADLSGFDFDIVFAFNVSLFYKGAGPSNVFDRVASGGHVGVFYQNPPGSDKQRLFNMLENVTAGLTSQGFTVLKRPVLKSVVSAPTGGVVAVKNRVA
jgi:SAM-dependent methyltransferase